MTTLTSGLRKIKPLANTTTMMFYFIMVFLLCTVVDAVIDDDCRGYCDDMIGYFCLGHLGMCVQCAVDCPNNDYPPCGDICKGFDKTPSPITNSTRQTTTTMPSSSSSPLLTSLDKAFWLTSTDSPTTSSSTTGNSIDQVITIAASVSFAGFLVALLVCLGLCPRFVRYCRRQRNKPGRQQEGDNQHAGLEMQPLRPGDPEANGPFMSPHGDWVDPEAEPRHGQESQTHSKEEGQYAVDTSNPVAGVYERGENSSVPVSIPSHPFKV